MRVFKSVLRKSLSYCKFLVEAGLNTARASNPARCFSPFLPLSEATVWEKGSGIEGFFNML